MDRTDYSHNLDYRDRVRAELLIWATRFLDGKAGLVETARHLSELNYLEPDWWDLVRIFVAVDSDADGIPTSEKMRSLWSPEGLKREDEKAAAIETHYAEPAKEAARSLVKLLTPTKTAWLARVREVLNRDWDPVCALPYDGGAPEDEYDTYRDKLASLISAGATDEELVAYLKWAERERMGIGLPTDAKLHEEGLRKVVAAIRAWGPPPRS